MVLLIKKSNYILGVFIFILLFTFAAKFGGLKLYLKCKRKTF